MTPDQADDEVSEHGVAEMQLRCGILPRPPAGPRPTPRPGRGMNAALAAIDLMFRNRN